MPYQHSDPWDQGFLQVSDIHQIYYEQYGKADGKPVVFLHGGPGGATSPNNTAFFNPDVYRVVLFDQRGAGKSTPAAELRENTSQLLVADIEALRKHCKVDKWFMVFGGSWGSTLALLYAQAHPERVQSLVLRGIFTIRKSEMDFSRGPDGVARIFPEHYDRYIEYLPMSSRHDPLGAYYKLLTSDDYQTKLEAARVWNRWDLALGGLFLPEGDLLQGKSEVWLLQHARLEAHYEINGGFIEEGHLLKPENLAKIAHLPCKSTSSQAFDQPELTHSDDRQHCSREIRCVLSSTDGVGAT